MNKRILSIIVPLVAIFAFALPAQADEKVALDKVPAKVKDTIQKEVQNGTITEIEREHHDGRPMTYEVEYRQADGKKFELKIGEDGTLLSKEPD